MTTLITGGGSQIGIHLAKLLKEAGREVIFASRSGKRIPEGFKYVELDWYNEATFRNPFKFGPFENAYIIGPPDTLDPARVVIPFIDIAVQEGVKRFVYLSATIADEEHNEGGLGGIPKYLKERDLDRVILRPTWFIGTNQTSRKAFLADNSLTTDNLLTEHGEGVRERGEFETAVPTARVPFIATEDIARAAFNGIVSEENSVTSFILLGPEPLTYDQVSILYHFPIESATYSTHSLLLPPARCLAGR